MSYYSVHMSYHVLLFSTHILSCPTIQYTYPIMSYYSVHMSYHVLLFSTHVQSCPTIQYTCPIMSYYSVHMSYHVLLFSTHVFSCPTIQYTCPIMSYYSGLTVSEDWIISTLNANSFIVIALDFMFENCGISWQHKPFTDHYLNITMLSDYPVLCRKSVDRWTSTVVLYKKPKFPFLNISNECFIVVLTTRTTDICNYLDVFT